MADARLRYFLTGADSGDGHALSFKQSSRSSSVPPDREFRRSQRCWLATAPSTSSATSWPLHNAMK